MNRMPLIVMISVVCSTYSWTDQVQSADRSACERHMVRYAKQHGVPLGILYAVGLTETGRKGSLHPYALNVEGRAVYAKNARLAMIEFDKARRRGARMIDLGCMQINHYWHHEEFDSVKQMLEPARNVEYAARFLKQLRQRESNWTMAVARYHTGPNNNPAQKRYVCRVIKNMVATGFARWTKKAKRFCR